MKIAPAVLVLALSVPLAACSSAGSDDDTATDPAGSAGSAPSSSAPADDAGDVPTSVPAAPGEVRSRGLVTVLESAENGRPELCVGAMIEIYPPQCGGPAVLDWDWAEQEGAEREGATRWGQYAVTGTWDGEALTVTEAVPAALHDAAVEEPPVLPEPSETLSEAELTRVAEEVGSLPGARGAYADGAGHVLVDVLYDDGTLQDAVDAEHGAGVVVVTPALVDVTG